MSERKQLSIFGATHDQNNYQSMTWGLLTFCPTKGNGWKDTCRHCLLWVPKDRQTDKDECLSAPCNSQDREDRQNGYFSIHNMPKKEKQNEHGN